MASTSHWPACSLNVSLCHEAHNRSNDVCTCSHFCSQTMFELLSGYGVWHRRYFVLEGSTLHYWNHPNDRETKVETSQARSPHLPPGRKIIDCHTLLSFDLPGSRGQNLSVQLPPQARSTGGEGFVRTAVHLWASGWPPAAERLQQPGQRQVGNSKSL